ncbi:MAG: NADH-quinone oxidoreductase subunit C [Micropruina sp.]|nr:NADH-quinone oxidoreductase subunit C [Micropruina sp.]
MTDQLRLVDAADWVAAIDQARRQGHVHFDWLGAVDEIGRSEEFRVVCRLLTAELDGLRLQTGIPRDAAVLSSIGAVFPGALWQEREAAEMLGIEFTGGDPRRLLLSPTYLGHPLRKDDILGARVTRPWPGSKEPGETSAAGRRRMVPPGVPDPEIWGARHGEPATADEVARSAVGGRVRRRS